MNSYRIKQFLGFAAILAVLAGSAGVVSAQDDDAKDNDGKTENATKNKTFKRTIKINRGGGQGADVNFEVRIEQFQNKEGSLWIGILCIPASPELRAHLQLPEGKGVMIHHLVEGAPAAKAGLKQYDVLLKAGDVELSRIGDLVKVIRDAGKHELTIELIQAGKPKTISVTPTDRKITDSPAPIAHYKQFIEELNRRLEIRGYRPTQFKWVRPGIVSNNAIAESLPRGLSVNINKSNNEPAQIVVRRAGKEWKVTEDSLEKLPDDIRPHVARMLAHKHGAQVQPQIRQWKWLLPQNTEFAPMPPLQTNRNSEKRFEAINQRLDELQKAIEKLSKQLKE